ncbi:MAG: GNAT family N-acetyltransferase [Deltaproteobacteria bacterium]|nr:GNAT family N-acetyltransferase [Deltaproteobacteria bacterium]
MEIHPLDLTSRAARETWDHFCSYRSNAWFWHTTDWLQYTLAYRPELQGVSLSFMVTEGDQIVAIVPLFLETHTSDRDSHRAFTFGGGYTPAPALSDQVRPERRSEVLQDICQRIDTLARAHQAARVLLQLSPLYWLGDPFDTILDLGRYGYLAVPLSTQVVRVNQGFSALRQQMRKGHTYDVKRGMRMFALTSYDAGCITEAVFDRYRLLHAKAAGRVTRPAQTFTLMYQWIREGKAVLIAATKDGMDAGFIYVFVYKKAAYYGSACNHPDWKRQPVGHALQGQALTWLAENEYAWYELGVQQCGPLLYDLPTDKELNIAAFKRGFGGLTVPLYRWEKFYSQEFFMQVYAERVRRYAEATFPAAEERREGKR